MNSNWSVLAVYQNADARQLAVQFCDALVERFWSEFSFELSWCDWANLESSPDARDAEYRVRGADVIIVATAQNGLLPPRIKSWLELTLHQRNEREGFLVGLPGQESGTRAEEPGAQLYLRKLAHEVGMDFLAAVPESLPHPEPESIDSYNKRATQITGVLDAILHRPCIPPRTI